MRKIFILVFVFLVSYPQYVFAVSELKETNDSLAEKIVKSESSSTVYYIDKNSVRHTFPNKLVYESWFGDSFENVKIVSMKTLSRYPLGGNVYLKSGKFLIKSPFSSKVYFVSKEGVLRHIKSEEIAKKIFGDNWSEKVRDFPDVFLSEYTIGDSIQYPNDYPDGIVYSINKEDGYYWKDNNALYRFNSWDDVVKNGYSRDDVIYGDRYFWKIKKPITGIDSRVSKVLYKSDRSSLSCFGKSYNIGLIYFTKDKSAVDLSLYQSVLDNYPEVYKRATKNLSEINIDKFYTIEYDQYFIDSKSGKIDLFELSAEFYKENSDNYDFLIVFNDFLPSISRTEAEYNIVSNSVYGNGKILINRTGFFGSSGRLKGVIDMGNVSSYIWNQNAGKTKLYNLINHEILHTWSASVSYIKDGVRRFDALSDDRQHWSKWVSFVSPLGEGGWAQNGKYGNYLKFTPINIGEDEILEFSDLDLYLMGLVPDIYISSFYIIKPEIFLTNGEVAGYKTDILIEDIIKAHGKIRCGLNNI